MPELPEAETLVRGLRPALVGRRIRHARIHHADVLRQPPSRFRDAVRGRTVLALERRAKNVLVRLSGDRVLAVNLGMTGWLAPVGVPGRDPPRPTHAAVTFVLEGPGSLVFDDMRRFGSVECLDGPTWRERDRRFGPEPLEAGFTARHLHEALGRSRSPVRSWLLDQRRIAGVGNIYAAEALFRARVHPARPARTLDHGEARALHRAVRSVLREAVRAGGTTIRDYRNADGGEGLFARSLRIYGREGEPCVRCKETVQRLVFAGRSAFFCPRCQPGGP